MDTKCIDWTPIPSIDSSHPLLGPSVHNERLFGNKQRHKGFLEKRASLKTQTFGLHLSVFLLQIPFRCTTLLDLQFLFTYGNTTKVFPWQFIFSRRLYLGRFRLQQGFLLHWEHTILACNSEAPKYRRETTDRIEFSIYLLAG